VRAQVLGLDIPASSPDNELVNRLWPGGRGIATVAIPADSAGGHTARAAMTGAVRLRERRAG
jgi:hypothetical protein